MHEVRGDIMVMEGGGSRVAIRQKRDMTVATVGAKAHARQGNSNWEGETRFPTQSKSDQPTIIPKKSHAASPRFFTLPSAIVFFPLGRKEDRSRSAPVGRNKQENAWEEATGRISATNRTAGHQHYSPLATPVLIAAVY